MKQSLLELYRYRELLLAITVRDIRIRYKQSIMGFLWAILVPLLIVLVGVMVRVAWSVASGAPVRLTDVLGVAVRSLPWALTVSSIRFASVSLIANPNLVTKIYFPKEIFPLSAVGANLFDFLIAGVPLAILLAIARVGVSIEIIWLPILLFTLTSLLIGLSLVTSAASLFFRDVKYIVEVFLTFGIFLTPVLYTADIFGKYSFYLMLNPLSAVMEGTESVLLKHQSPDLYWLGYSLAVGLILMVGGYRFFKRLEPAFAESI